MAFVYKDWLGVMFCVGLSEVWNFIFHHEFILRVTKEKSCKVIFADYLDKWQGYIYIDPEKQNILCFTELDNLIRTLSVLYEVK